MERLELPFSHSAARMGREFVTVFCTSRGVSQTVRDDAVLITSELVTNAYLHARTTTTLGVDLRAGVLRVEVTDQSAGRPVLGQPEDGRPGGRGLVLLDSLAQSWGVDGLQRGGKTVWFELHSDP